MDLFSFNPPGWTGEPRQIGVAWELRKGSRVARCVMVNHPVRPAELRCEVDGELQQSQADDFLPLCDLAQEWKRKFIEKGWA